jgi:hypothetical protein
MPLQEFLKLIQLKPARSAMKSGRPPTSNTVTVYNKFADEHFEGDIGFKAILSVKRSFEQEDLNG